MAETGLEGVDSLVVNEAALRLLPHAWGPIRARLEDHRLRRRSAERFAPERDANRRANADRFLDARPVRGLFDAAPGAAAVVAGAGPSLTAACGEIRAARDRCLLVATAAALGPLEAAGLAADLAVLSDPQAECALQVAGLAVPLVAFPSSAADALAAARGPLLGAFPVGEGGAEWAPLREAFGELEAGGSVVTTAIDLAVRLGASRVVLAGVDLAWTGRAHAAGYARDERGAAEAGRFATVETISAAAAPRRRITETAVDGSRVETAENLLAYRRWIEAKARRTPGVRFMQAARGGLPIRGAAAATVGEALRGAPPAPRLPLPAPTAATPDLRAAWRDTLLR